jgi:hypothetical protein
MAEKGLAKFGVKLPVLNLPMVNDDVNIVLDSGLRTLLPSQVWDSSAASSEQCVVLLHMAASNNLVSKQARGQAW